MSTTEQAKKRNWILGLGGICVPAAGIIILCLFNDFFGSGIGDVFDLCMDVLGGIVCVLLFYGCMSAQDIRVSHDRTFIITLLNAKLQTWKAHKKQPNTRK